MKLEILIIASFILLTMIIGVVVHAKSGKSPSKRYLPVKLGYGYSVFDPKTKQWLQRQVQLRVSKERQLPEPLISPEHGNELHCTDYGPGFCGTGNMIPDRYVIKDNFKVWQWRKHVNYDDLLGQTAFSITVDRWKDGSKKSEPTEIFAFPAIAEQEPGQWTEWQRASSQRPGDFAWWSEVHKQDLPEPVSIEHPFEMRFRLRLTPDEPRIVDDDEIEYSSGQAGS